MIPKDRRYLKTHEWAKKDGDVVTVGITDYAVKHLSDLVFLDLPPAGTQVLKEQAFGEVESVKAVSEIYSPVNGEVVETNIQLPEHLEKLSADPYNEGWMIKVRVGDGSGFDALMDAEDYENLIRELDD